MKSFEDLGFACLDNAPPALAHDYLALVRESGRDAAAIAFDVESGGGFGNASETVDALVREGLEPRILFLDADDATLVRRYSETRRRHPYAGRAATLVEAIERERATLAGLRARADVVWDTSHFTHAMLKTRIAEELAGGATARTNLTVIAFGYKFGTPMDADWVFDVRFLPNPHYVPELRPLTGNDAPIVAFLEAAGELEPFLERLFALVDFVLPRARTEGKAHLTFAVGCTGGRHRSVYVARRLADHIAATGAERPAVVERDIVR